MNKCSKIVFGYILVVVLLTVSILSVNIQLRKNVRDNFYEESKHTRFEKKVL